MLTAWLVLPILAALATVRTTSALSNAAQGLQSPLLASVTTGPNADALVSQSSPSKNYGTASSLQVSGASHSSFRSYIRFAVSGVSGPIQSVTLRVYCTTDGTTNGPEVYLADSNWIESGKGGITWNNQPALVGGVIANAGAIAASSWVSYDVTSAVTGNGTYTFALFPDSTDSAIFSSREGAMPAQLVITLANTPTPTSTAVSQPSNTPTAGVAATNTPTPTAPSAASPTPTSTSGTIALAPTGDTYVDSSLPSSNFGTANPLIASASVRRALLMFNTALPSGSTVSSVTLRVFSKSTASSGGYEVHPELDTWAENTVTWNSQPSWNATILATSSSPVAGAWTDIALPVSSVNAAGNTAYGIRFSVSGINAQFASREDAVNPPQLVIAYSTGSAQSSTPSPSPTATAIGAPTQTPTSAPTATATSGSSGSIQHVFVVLMENHSYSQVWNTSSSPYITQLGNAYARATNYYAITHPSLPNYLDLYGGSNYGITTDCEPSSTCHVSAVSLADNLEAKGLTWRGYMESMPSPCYLTTSGTYAPKHNPFVYFDAIRTNTTRCDSHDVPYSDLSSDLASASTTPNYAFITPNLCNDMHDCSVSTGDTWLSNNLPPILNSPACTVDKCLLILTWDEDDNSAGNHVLTIFAGSAAKTGGVTSSVSYNHFSLLRTVEDIFGLPTQTSNDAAASPMTDLLR